MNTIACYAIAMNAGDAARLHGPQAAPQALHFAARRSRLHIGRPRHGLGHPLASATRHDSAAVPGITLRAATVRDVDAIAHVLALCGSAWKQSHVRDEFTRPVSHVVVATTEEASVVGVCVAWKVAGETHVMELGVHPDFRRRGIATRMLDECVHFDCDKDAGGVTLLEVRESNSEARSMYARLGFVEVGKRSKYYPDGEAAVLCTRREG
jgi:[ribosomal protein S18]-alanine N-acetyltransferase